MIGAVCTGLRSSAVLMLALLAGCGHVPIPWHRKPPPAPQEVHELVITRADGSTAEFPQYWKRNTLVLDLQGAAGTGSIVLKPREKTTWPVRIAFRVMPGQMGILDVRADEQSLVPVTTDGTKPVDLELYPGLYTLKTPQITVMWEPLTPPPPL